MRIAAPALSPPAGARHAGAHRLVSRGLGIALAISLMLHGLVLSLQFRPPEGKPARDRGLEVVLVNARHAKPPQKADVLAQANLAGGGTSDKKDARPKSPLPPQNARRDGDALVEQKRRQPQQAQAQQQVLTRDKAAASVASRPQQTEQPTSPPVVSGLDLLDSAAAVARLEAQIDRSLDELSKRPRTQFIGARAREYRFAQYVEDWRQKVERIGTLNYPDAARGRMYGSLLLSVTIRADGSVERVGVHRSSGHKVLDDAAVRIVRMAAPYAPFPPDIRRDTDMIEITRTWTFTNADEVRAN
ncbi:energy transducer TonB [Thauera sinica]|uniref:Energy transducer TonB n=1 Tax=Thauera sinica TaxID=2665146 RepID=A0ABW1AUU1_9RHOO|nr:TonB family protein [Thauera sp. K11]ATE62364.1 energy transducer TonB [Thauera sp. K11]